MKEDTILKVLPWDVRSIIQKEKLEFEYLQEIRLREGKPLIFLYHDTEVIPGAKARRPYLVTKDNIREMLEYISNYSLYACEQEMRQGFITIEGGHRVGLSGQAIMENGKVKNLKYISSVNIRVAHEKKGCAKEILPYLKNGNSIYNTLLVSKPGAGKTTCLRDCIRSLSNGKEGWDGMKICVLDERSEIAACHLGIPQNDMGMRTDVLSGCEKSDGMILMLRSMSPQIIAVDELGGKKDFEAVEQAAYSGVHILGTVHADTVEELWEKPYLRQGIKKGIFERFILIRRSRSGEREFQVFNGKRERLC